MKKRKHRGPKRHVTRLRTPDDQALKVRRLKAEGYSGDEIAQLIGLNKNSLRAQHALDLREGRELARAEADAAEGEKLTVEEETKKRAMLAGFGTHWENADGTCDLHHGNTLEQQ